VGLFSAGLREHSHCRLEQFRSIDSHGSSLKHVASSLVCEGFASPENRFRKTANLLTKAGQPIGELPDHHVYRDRVPRI
jgi:hypothetical protein